MGRLARLPVVPLLGLVVVVLMVDVAPLRVTGGVALASVLSLVLFPRRALAMLLVAPCSVTLVSCGTGCWSYANGTGAHLHKGLPGYSSSNLDPRTRAPHTTEGCMVTGFEPLTQLPNNLAIAWLSRQFGPMPGAYVGPYPTKDEAWRLVRDAGTSTPRAGLETGAMDLGERRFEVGDELLIDLGATFSGVDSDLRFVELDGGALVMAGDRGDGRASAVAIVDFPGQRLVARWLVSRAERVNWAE